MKKTLMGSMALSAAFACTPAGALEGLGLFDDFSTTPLDPGHWIDSERSRLVSGNALRLVQRDWGQTTSDSGTFQTTFAEPIARPGPVTQFRANVKVNAIDLKGCAANPSATRVRARVLGTFFNTGNRVSGSNVGDVVAQIYLYRDSTSADAPGVMRVQGALVMCTAADCRTAFGFGAPAILGTVDVGTSVLLQIDWDRANKQFLFSRDKGTPTAVAYSVDDSYEPGSPGKQVNLALDVANCASGPRAFGFIDARFDNVAVNASAKP